MSSRFAGFRDFSTGVIIWVAIIFIILAVVWFILSFIANCTNFGEPTVPDIEKAEYEFTIRANGRILYTNSYEVSTNGDCDKFTLYGYYEFQDNKFKWNDKDLILDEYYYGSIDVSKRVVE